MQKNLKNTLYLLAMLVGIFLNSCQTNKELEETVTSAVKIDGQSLKHVNLFFTDNEKSFSCELDTPEQEKTFNALKNHFGGEISKITTKPFLLTIYTKNGLRDIKFDDVIGISVFVKDVKSDLFQHSFFVVAKNTTKEDMRFSAKCSQVVADNLKIMGDFIFKDTTFSYGTMVSMSKKTSKSFESKKEIDMLSYVISEYTGNTARAPRCNDCRRYIAGHCMYGEGPGSDSGTGRYCYPSREDEIPPTGGGGGCQQNKRKDLSVQSGLNISELSSNEILYDFRDNFMLNYSKGSDYVDYYYALGIFMNEKSIINASNISQYLQFTVNTCNIATKLKSGNDKDIVVTLSYKEDALQIINSLRTQVGENASIANILNSIEADLNLYVNKTPIEILNTLN